MSQGILGNSESLRRIMAGPVCDLIVKLNGPDGKDYETALNKLLRREDFTWSPQLSRNKHGHVIVTVTGVNLTGAQEIERLKAAGYNLSDYARSLLLSKKKDGYDLKHRLEEGKIYTFALLPGNAIATNTERTTSNLKKLAITFGYEKPLAGSIFRIREAGATRTSCKLCHLYTTLTVSFTLCMTVIEFYSGHSLDAGGRPRCHAKWCTVHDRDTSTSEPGHG